MKTPYEKHRIKWKDCQLCELSKCRKNVVLGRGAIPAPILFVGEAPGVSEDCIGYPFIGLAGKLLDRIIKRSLGEKFSYAITNLIACIPKKDGSKIGEPPKESIAACQDRLLEFVEICRPELVVLIGKVANKYFPKGYKTVKIIHPAAILRMNEVAQPLEVKRCIVTIADAVEEYLT